MKTFSRSQMREVYESWQNTSVNQGTCTCKQQQILGVADFLDYLATYEFSSHKELAMSSNRSEGKIKWFNKDKGYGFITTASGDVFIHCTAVAGYEEGKLKEGDKVEFDVFQSTKGPQARNVVAV